MAQTGFTPIQLYYSSTTTNAPTAGNLASGELAINITDGKLFYKDNANVVQVIGWKTTPATAGGTGQTSYAVGDLLYANTTTTLAKLADVATGNALISGGVGVAPSWGKIGLTTHVSGTLPTANGGTNLTSFTANGIMYASSTSALATGSVLTFDGTTLTNNGNTVLGDANSDTVLMTAAPSIGGAGYGMGMAFRNRLINGSFAVDQRNAGAAQTITAAAALAYTVDRWYAYSTGANVTGQQIAGAYTSSKYQYKFTGAASVTAIGFGQRIESANCFDLANNTATLSCFISNSLLTTVTWTAYYANTTDAFGTLASPTVTSIATGTFTVTSSRVRYSANISIPSAATTGIQIVFTVGAQTSGTWIIDSVQLEKGGTAIAYDDRPYGTELVLSQRYYQQIGKSNNVSYQPYGVGVCTSTTTTSIIINLPVMMRVTPTLTFNGATNTFTGTAGTAVTALVSDVMSPTTIMYQASVAVGLVTGNGARHYQNSTNASSLELSSEL